MLLAYDRIKMEKFSLSWNEFIDNVSTSFRKLRQDKDYSDVTLVCDDEKSIRAHKVVLSSSSEFFRNVLKLTKDSNNPIIYLNGVNYKHLTYMLDYIYLGQIQIYEVDLEKFLAMAQNFKIEGLLHDELQPDLNIPNPLWVKGEMESHMNSIVDKKNLPEEVEESKSLVPTLADNLTGMETADELVQRIQKDLFACRKCGKTAKTKYNLTVNIETHIEGLSYDCKLCPKSFKTRNSLNYHRYEKHRGM